MCVVTLSALQSHSTRNDSKDISILDVLVSGSLLCHVMLVVIYLTICNGGFNMKVIVLLLLMCVVTLSVLQSHSLM